jgi:acetoin utilization deacetylase AcuC-like enzyme
VIAFHFDPHVLPLPPGHRFPIGKYGLLRRRVEADPRGIELRIAGAASDGELALAHDPTYISDVLDGTLSPARQREIGFEWTPALAARAVRSVGATIAAARVALFGDEPDGPAGGVSASLGGGTHHANATQGSGYCVFNDVAVAARLMQAEWHRRHRKGLQVVVIDLDVHQGNGTAAIFENVGEVFTFSMHGERNYPTDKMRSDLDVALEDGAGDGEYLAALGRHLPEVLEAAQADIAFYVAGVDVAAGDRYGRLALSEEGIRARDCAVIEAVRGRGVPMAIVLGGGYAATRNRTAELHAHAFREAVAYERR